MLVLEALGKNREEVWSDIFSKNNVYRGYAVESLMNKLLYNNVGDLN